MLPHHAPQDYCCPFCIITGGMEDSRIYSRQADVFYRDADLTGLIPSHHKERNPGNAIIVPNAHYENLYEMPDELLARIGIFSKRLALAMKAAYACSGISTRQHNEPDGNQDVWHYHLHVFPRYPDDQLYTSKSYFSAEEDRARYADLLRQVLIQAPDR